MDAAAALPPVCDLYRQHRLKALAIARRILGDADEAEDVVQEVFARLCSGPARFDGKAAPSSWLHRIMLNSSINSLRSRRRRSQLQALPAPPVDPEEAAITSELSSQLDAALEQLTDQHRQVLLLREWRGLSYSEIGALLGVPEGTVKSALHRGRTRLAEALAQNKALP